MRKSFFWGMVACLVLQACTSLQPRWKREAYGIAFYNVENLFDVVDDEATRDEEFTPEGRNAWTQERYQDKLQKLAEVIDSLDAKGLALLGLAEVENERVLQDLIAQPTLLGKELAIVHRESPDGRGIDVALIYRQDRFKPFAVEMLPVAMPNPDDYPTRDIMLVGGTSPNSKDSLFVFVNHWPSRSGGEERSAPKRMAAAKVARKAVDSLLAVNPKRKIVLIGDLNDEPSNLSLREGLRAAGALDTLKSDDLFNTTYALEAAGLGTYNYRGNWNMLDQVVISQSLMQSSKGFRYQPNSVQIYSPGWLQQTGDYAGYPSRTFVGPRYLGGYSDHFPVYMALEFK